MQLKYFSGKKITIPFMIFKHTKQQQRYLLFNEYCFIALDARIFYTNKNDCLQAFYLFLHENIFEKFNNYGFLPT